MTNEGTYKYVSINLIDKPNLSPYLDILYFKDNRIDIDRAVEVSSIILSMEEDFGTHNIILITEPNVSFSMSSTMYFGSPEHISGVHNIAMHSIGMKKWVVRLLNMIHALKSSPNTRYFNSKEECVSWLENKLIKTK